MDSADFERWQNTVLIFKKVKDTFWTRTGKSADFGQGQDTVLILAGTGHSADFGIMQDTVLILE